MKGPSRGRDRGRRVGRLADRRRDRRRPLRRFDSGAAGHGDRVAGRRTHRCRRRHLADHARHAAPNRRQRDGFHSRVRCLVQAGLALQSLARRLEHDDYYFIPSFCRRATPKRTWSPAGSSGTPTSVRRPGELSAAPVRAEQGAEAGRYARISQQWRTTPTTSTPASSECFCASTAPNGLACGSCSIT